MREIKFRAWSIQFDDAGKMIYMNPPDGSFKDLVESDKWKVMQFTEIRDSNGNDIYEGDIIKCDDKIGEVQYDKQQGTYIILWQPNNEKRKNGCDDLASTFPSIVKVVIGNIYENPEIIKEAN